MLPAPGSPQSQGPSARQGAADHCGQKMASFSVPRLSHGSSWRRHKGPGKKYERERATDDGEEATGIDNWVPPPPTVDALLKERQQEALAVQAPAPWLQLSTFLAGRGWSYPLAPNVPHEQALENRVSRMGTLRPGPLAASLGDLGQAHRLPRWVLPAVPIFYSKSAACNIFRGECSCFWGK